MRSLALLLLIACGPPTVHDLVECEVIGGDGTRCEYGCRRGPGQPTPVGPCYLDDPTRTGDVEICPRTFYSDGHDGNRHGCCVEDFETETLRFRECCEEIRTDGGVRYECP